MDEWFFTQSLVGYKKILEDYGEKVEITNDGIVVEKHHLEMMADAFFTYYLKNYSVAAREERLIMMNHNKFKNGDQSAKTELNRRINESKKKVARDFNETFEGERVVELADLYRKQKKYVREMDDWIEEFIGLLYTTDIDTKLTSNFFKSVILRPYFGQVTFLNVTHNRKTIDEQKAIFYKDLIEPILEEWKLIHLLNQDDEKEILSMLESTSHNLMNSIKRAFRKKSVSEMNEYLLQEVHKCSFTDFPVALLSFEEGVFSPLALSLNRSINMTWNSNGKKMLPLSSLARLLIFCSQAGATHSQGKSIFVYYGGSFEELYSTNQFYADLKNQNKSFDEIVFDLVREEKFKAKYHQNHYMIYEYESDYDARKTLLDYMVMTPNLIKLFTEHSNLFKHIHYTVKSEMVRNLLQERDTKNLITNVLRDKIKNSYSPFEVIQMIQIRHLNQLYKKEVMIVDSNKQKRYVWALVKSAEQVKYQIGEKKAQGIAYRLLNAVRSNNKNTFMDTVMRTYISCDQHMPGLLLEALHEDKMDFATVGNAWIAGLVSKPNDIKEGEEEVEQQ